LYLRSRRQVTVVQALVRRRQQRQRFLRLCSSAITVQVSNA
jgi:hypothetical protein